MKLSDFLEGVGRPVAYYPSLSRALGDIKIAIFVCQMAYWKGKETDPEGWIYKESDEIETETALSYKEQIRIRAYLIEKKLLEEKYVRTEHKMYFRVNWDSVNKAWDEYMTNGHMPNGQVLPEHMPNGQKPTPQRAGGSLPKGSSLNSNSEITPETTREKDSLIKKIQSHAVSALPNWKVWHSMSLRLDDDSILIAADGAKIIVSGLSAKQGQFTEAQVWTAKYCKSFENSGLILEFRE